MVYLLQRYYYFTNSIMSTNASPAIKRLDFFLGLQINEEIENIRLSFPTNCSVMPEYIQVNLTPEVLKIIIDDNSANLTKLIRVAARLLKSSRYKNSKIVPASEINSSSRRVGCPINICTESISFFTGREHQIETIVERLFDDFSHQEQDFCKLILKHLFGKKYLKGMTFIKDKLIQPEYYEISIQDNNELFTVLGKNPEFNQTPQSYITEQISPLLKRINTSVFSASPIIPPSKNSFNCPIKFIVKFDFLIFNEF